jgi:hypothetical protein
MRQDVMENAAILLGSLNFIDAKGMDSKDLYNLINIFKQAYKTQRDGLSDYDISRLDVEKSGYKSKSDYMEYIWFKNIDDATTKIKEATKNSSNLSRTLGSLIGFIDCMFAIYDDNLDIQPYSVFYDNFLLKHGLKFRELNLALKEKNVEFRNGLLSLTQIHRYNSRTKLFIKLFGNFF